MNMLTRRYLCDILILFKHFFDNQVFIFEIKFFLNESPILILIL